MEYNKKDIMTELLKIDHYVINHPQLYHYTLQFKQLQIDMDIFKKLTF